ncbi:MAG: phosphotransferase, partial [Anaerolineae bacterium]|nr:phosphotransferase [Anaerolineae bacterium]
MSVFYPIPMLPHGTVSLASDLYNLHATAKALPGEKDLNFRLTTTDGEYLLKIANPAEPRENLELQIAALEHVLSQLPIANVQRVIRSTSGQAITAIQTPDGERLAHLLTFIPGKLWAHCNPHTPEMLRNLGRALGTLDGALSTFSHPAAKRHLKWDLARAEWIRDYVHLITDPARRALVEKYLRIYSSIHPQLSSLRHQVIYNDANDYNIVVVAQMEGDGAPSPVPTGEGADGIAHRRGGGLSIALIDFGDILHSNLICDLAIACAYAMLDKADPLSAACEVVAGFHETYPLQEAELEVLFPLIAMRLSVSVTNSAWQSHSEPNNTYLQISARPAWALLEKLEAIHPNLARYRFR